jgi:integrase
VDRRQRQGPAGVAGNEGARWKPLTARSLEQLARRRIAELEEKARRQRHGLEPLPSETLGSTFGELRAWWWEQKGKTLRSTMVRPFLETHLAELDGEPLRDVTSVRLQRLLADKAEHLAPKSLNHLRGFPFNFYAVARKPGGPCEGRANPVEDVERFKVAGRPRRFLELAEWEPVLVEVPVEWRGPVAVGLYAGLREGEIFGLLKADVDLDRGAVMVWRSWDAPRTKDGKAMPVPVHEQLRPRLVLALHSPGPLLFPQADGSMYSRKLRLNRMLRAALARAGVIEGFEHRCRAPHCGRVERHTAQDDAPPASCPRCGKPTTWAKPLPRHVTFHGTRHSFGTAVVRGAGTAVAQKALRHSDVRLTIGTYGHLDDGDVRDGLTRSFLQAGAAPVLRNPSGGAPAGAAQRSHAAENWLQPPDATDETATAAPQNVCTNSPERSLGSNQVLLGGMSSPASETAMSCSMRVGKRWSAIDQPSAATRFSSSFAPRIPPTKSTFLSRRGSSIPKMGARTCSCASEQSSDATGSFGS